MSYMTIFSQEKHHFSLCSYFHAHPTTLLLKILGGPMHGPSPHLKFWRGDPPSPPLGLRLWSSVFCAYCLAIKLVCTEQEQHFQMLVCKSVSVWGHKPVHQTEIQQARWMAELCLV